LLSTLDTVVSKKTLSQNQKRLLRQLIYYSIFNYPLSLLELGSSTSNSELEEELKDLEEQDYIQELDNVYGVNLTQEIVTRRQNGTRAANEILPKAKSNANLIFNFPFVKGVYVSGSLSKGFMSEDGDIDYFIITKPGKLWVTRTLLILYKKLFLFNSRKYFCVNYFVDANHLEIAEKNVFTATELVTLIPMKHDSVNNLFISNNEWIKSVYPNKQMNQITAAKTKKLSLKSFIESLLNNWFGNQLDYFFMKITMLVWKQKFGDFKPVDFELAMKSRSYVSKHHPQNFQKKVLDAFDEKIKLFENEHGIDLNL
jgi:hypothetical protein